MNKIQVYAGLLVRILAFALDYLIIAIYLALVTVLGLTIRLIFPNIPLTLFSNPVSGQITGFVVITLPVTSYFALFESSSWQATPGKYWKKLRVVGKDNEQLGKVRSISRTLLKFIPWELAHTCIWQISFAREEPSPIIIAGFVLVWILVAANIASLLISPSHQTLYDWVTESYVITDRAKRILKI